MAVHTCPRCELRFEREQEVIDHLATDHGIDPATLASHPNDRYDAKPHERW